MTEIDGDEDFDEIGGFYKPRLVDELALRDLFAAVALHAIAGKYGYSMSLAKEASDAADEMMRRRV